jgi:hypothetical protein
VHLRAAAQRLPAALVVVMARLPAAQQELVTVR